MHPATSPAFAEEDVSFEIERRPPRPGHNFSYRSTISRETRVPRRDIRLIEVLFLREFPFSLRNSLNRAFPNHFALPLGMPNMAFPPTPPQCNPSPHFYPPFTYFLFPWLHLEKSYLLCPIIPLGPIRGSPVTFYRAIFLIPSGR